MNIIMSWAMNHQDYLLGLASGWAVGHIPLLIRLGFKQAMRVNWIRGYIIKNPEEAKKMIQEIEKELESDIDEELKSTPGNPPAPTA